MKQRIQGVIIGAVLVFVLLGGIFYVATPKAIAAAAIERWEYITVKGSYRSNFSQIIEEANKLGKEGWELVTGTIDESHAGYIFFKRRLP